MYCYQIVEKLSDQFGFKVKYCPHRKFYKTRAGVRIPYCAYLGMYGWPGGINNKQFKKLHEQYGEKIWDMFPLPLLWDGVKECGENYGDPAQEN